MVMHIEHIFSDLNAAHVQLTVLDKVGPLLGLLTVEEEKAFLVQTAVAVLLDRSLLVSHKTVEVMYHGGHVPWGGQSPWRLHLVPHLAVQQATAGPGYGPGVS